jgi:hypothetical protein
MNLETSICNEIIKKLPGSVVARVVEVGVVGSTKIERFML